MPSSPSPDDAGSNPDDSGMSLMSEMFQRQARRLEAQHVSLLEDRKVIETVQKELAAVQGRVQWHGNAMRQHAERLLWTEEAMQRMRLQLDGIREDHRKAVSSANALLADVKAHITTLQRDAPERLRTIVGQLSDVASGQLSAMQRDSSTDSSDGASGTNSGVSTTSTFGRSASGAAAGGAAADGAVGRGAPPAAE